MKNFTAAKLGKGTVVHALHTANGALKGSMAGGCRGNVTAPCDDPTTAITCKRCLTALPSWDTTTDHAAPTAERCSLEHGYVKPCTQNRGHAGECNKETVGLVRKTGPAVETFPCARTEYYVTSTGSRDIRVCGVETLNGTHAGPCFDVGTREWFNEGTIPAELCPHGIDAKRPCSICRERVAVAMASWARNREWLFDIDFTKATDADLRQAFDEFAPKAARKTKKAPYFQYMMKLVIEDCHYRANLMNEKL